MKKTFLPKNSDISLLTGIVILLSATHLVPFHLQPFLNCGTLVLTLLSWQKKQKLNFQLGLVSLIGMLHWFFLFPIWPLPLIAGIATTAGVGLFLKNPLFSLNWLRKGKFERSSLILSTFFILTSSISLLLWFLLFKPDLTDLKAFIPNQSLPVLVAGGIAFSIANAFAEEFLFRGILFQALSQHLKYPWKVIFIQGVAFGCLHMNGFPRGIFGVLLASIYGFMMGTLRHVSRGLLVPWLIHIFADITIVAILLAFVS